MEVGIADTKRRLEGAVLARRWYDGQKGTLVLKRLKQGAFSGIHYEISQRQPRNRVRNMKDMGPAGQRVRLDLVNAKCHCRLGFDPAGS